MIFIDLEASGLHGFPTEVGWCKVNVDRTLTSGAMLICVDEWLDDFAAWDLDAEALTGITREMLVADGHHPREAAAWLNAALAGTVGCCDHHGDKHWTAEIFRVARLQADFVLADTILAYEGPEIDRVAFNAACDRIDAVAPKQHRAESDAVHLATLYVMSLRPSAPVHRLFLTDGGRYERRPLVP